MLFATGSLAKRIEEAESTLIAHFGRAVGHRDGRDRVVIADVGGGTAVIAGPTTPFSKVAGLGFAAVDESVLEGIEREYARRAMPVRVELASLGDPAVGSLLTRRGYVLSGFENVLGLRLPPVHASPPQKNSDPQRSGAPAISVTRAERDETRLWLDVVATGFANPDVFDGPPPTETFDRSAIDQALAPLS
jgi:hypothetical protein